MAKTSSRKKLAAVIAWLSLAWIAAGIVWIPGLSSQTGIYSAVLVFVLPAGLGLVVAYILDRSR